MAARASYSGHPDSETFRAGRGLQACIVMLAFLHSIIFGLLGTSS